MIERNPAMLARSEWREALYELSICCVVEEARSAGDRVRELNVLLMMAPGGALILGLQPLRPARLEALLDLGACESAVMAMFDDGAGFLVSHSGDGQSLATIALPGDLAEKSGSGATPALALIGAIALLLSNAAMPAQVTSAHAGMKSRPALH